MKPNSNKIKTILLPWLGARKIKALNNEKERHAAVFKELVEKNKSERSQHRAKMILRIAREITLHESLRKRVREATLRSQKT